MIELATQKDIAPEVARSRRRAKEGGFGFGFGRRRAGRQGPGYPSTISCDAWFRDYAGGSTWAGLASLGSSGSKSFTSSVGTVGNGSVINTRSSFLAGTTSAQLVSASLMSSVVSNAGYTFWAVVRSTVTLPTGGGVIGDDTVSIWEFRQFQSGGNSEIALQQGGDLGTPQILTDTNPHLFMQYWDGAQAHLQVDGGSLQGGSSVIIPSMTTTTLRVGSHNSASTASTQMEIFEFGFINAVQSDFPTFATNMRNYVRSWYAFNA